MYKEIKIGEVEVPMLATAATQYRYKNVFHEDLFRGLSHASKEDAGLLVDIVMKLGFIMAKQAERSTDWGIQNEDAFIDWVDLFDSTAMIDSIDVILELYNANTNQKSKQKKTGGAQTAK